MAWLTNLPIKRKLTLVILSTCSVVLCLACGVLAIYEVLEFRRTMVRDTTVLADVLAKNTGAALAFSDEEAAEETLLALQAEPYVSEACLYDSDGHAFVQYARGSSPAFPANPGNDGPRFEGGYLSLFRPVVLHNKRIGTIYLRADLQGVYDRLGLFAGVGSLVLCCSLALATVLSSRFQRPISQPILALADTARRVAERRDYSVRAAVAQGTEEAGLLAAAFNQMLDGIEERERALRTANEALLGENVERKSAEGRVHSQLMRLELLNRTTRAIGERQDLKSIFQVVIRTLEDDLPLDFGCVGLYVPEDGTLTVTCVGLRGDPLASELAVREQARIAIDKNGLSRCVNGQLVYEPDISQSECVFPKMLTRSGMRSLVLAPLLVESKVFGVLVSARRAPEGFSSGECEFLRQLSEHVGLAAHQTQLYTALQQAYDDLRQTQQAVMQQERLRALGQMASGIAHDINNAISPVALYTESLLENEPTLSPRARDYLATIQRAVDDVAQTVARMREFYRQREPQLLLAPVQVNALVEQVIGLSRARWSDMPQQRGIVVRVVTELEADLPDVMGVESEIREALVNLVFNAVDAMPEGGVLTLRTYARPRPNGSAPGAGANQVSIEVCDTGIGMSDDTRRRCLEPFFTTKGERGTGLGLAMVYGVMQRHSGDVEVQSALGKGTTVRLGFSVAGREEVEPAAPDSAPAVLSGLRILVIDDDPMLTKSLRDILQTDGHTVVITHGGQEGIDTFKASETANEPFSVVITDLGMPHVDGRRVARSIKNASPHTPVILLTGWGQRLVAEGDVPEHVDRVLNKPPKLRELREALAHCLRPTSS